jgi:hypothetical protein
MITKPDSANLIGWMTFLYDGKARGGLIIGPDTRPGTNNVVCLTADGVRAFKVSKMEEVVDETTLYA